MKVRTRFAPSPTGYMHVGNLRTALYAYLLARKTGGSFILRIEDTDRERYVPGAEQIIYSTLKEAGLNWDEGPDVGGPFGPYVQSQRQSSYMQRALELVEKGEAYYCFCTKQELEQRLVKQQFQETVTRYDGHCRELTPDEVRQKLDSGCPFVIRQKMPREGTTTFHDLVYGDIAVDNSELEDQILIKSDGMPTYNFANVVDDHDMAINCVIRGNEYLSSTPKYNLLYEAFGWEVPQYIHCPQVMKDAHRKLSKRYGDASYKDFVDKGYLPAAIINYLALTGWSPGGEREIFTLEELCQVFDVSGISKSPAIFDYDKLRYINAEHIRALPPEEFQRLATPYIQSATSRRDIDLAVLCEAMQPRCEILSDIPPKLAFLDRVQDYELDLYSNRKMKTSPETAKQALALAMPVLEQLERWDRDSIHDALFQLIEQNQLKNGFLLWPLRVALSGMPTTPGGGIELAAVLGREDTLARLRAALERLEEQEQ